LVALNQDFLARVYPPTEAYEVGREKIREFAQAVGETNPACHDPAVARALGYPDVIAPPTFAIRLTMPASEQVTKDPALGLDYSRVVHGEQRFVHHRPIHAGDRLRVVITVESIRALADNDMLTTRADVLDDADELVLSAYGTLVARGTP
jgi:acyl dehydratase